MVRKATDSTRLRVGLSVATSLVMVILAVANSPAPTNGDRDPADCRRDTGAGAAPPGQAQYGFGGAELDDDRVG